MKRKRFFLKLLMVLIPWLLAGLSAVAQNKMYSGTVTEKNGTSIPGVAVVVKGQNIGTVTDFDGKFSLSVPVGAKTLVFSFVGLTPQEITLGTNTTLSHWCLLKNVNQI